MTPKRILGFLLPALIAALIYGYLQMPQQERVTTGDGKVNQPPQAKKKGPTQQTGSIGKEGYPRLRSDLLEHKSQPYPGVRRDLFSAVLTARQSEIEALPEELPEVIVPPVVAVAPPPPPPPPSPQEVARQELSKYQFVGFFKKGEKQTIFLSTAGEIFLVRKGEYLGRDRQYYVLNVTETTLELRKNGAGDFSIKLTDQEALSAVPFQSVSPATPSRPTQESGINLSDQPEFLTVPDNEPQSEDQPQPEEDNL